MTDIERKAALTLRPYMSKDPVILDIGSNKGDWAAILGPNSKEVHLFEPNEVLLHYSMVRFESLTSVFYYNQFGLFSSQGHHNFYYFTNVNNGLSSVYRNQLWVDMGLPMKEKEIWLTTLDKYWNGQDKIIDFIKIDVEGADFEVLKGAESLLKNKLIKFIQVEHSEHILLSGHTWPELVQYMELNGYFCHDFDGDRFFRVNEYTGENYYFMEEFTQDWNGEFKKNTKGMKFDLALEIGCFEGLTTNYICDNLLNPSGRIICIDPLPDNYNDLPFGDDNKIFEGQYDRFIRNTSGRPVELIRNKSRLAFKKHGFSDYRFDFIYVDGDHREDEVYLDGANGFNLLKKGGFILFDDFEWRAGTKNGINRFMREYSAYMEVVHVGYQVMIKKIHDAQ